MQDHRATIEQFYTAFSRLDADRMAMCYGDDVEFQDEVFKLRGKQEVMGMWRMLCDAVREKGKDDWKLAFSKISGSGDAAQAHWDADYRFSATGRLVHNSIDARFVFDHKGLIVRHRDTFDFWAWSRQALGAPGLLLGWSPFLKNKVRATAAGNLKRYLEGKA